MSTRFLKGGECLEALNIDVLLKRIALCYDQDVELHTWADRFCHPSHTQMYKQDCSTIDVAFELDVSNDNMMGD